MAAKRAVLIRFVESSYNNSIERHIETKKKEAPKASTLQVPLSRLPTALISPSSPIPILTPPSSPPDSDPQPPDTSQYPPPPD